MPTEEELDVRMEELAAQISTQGGKVKGLKDEVKGLKKNKVRSLTQLKLFLCSWKGKSKSSHFYCQSSHSDS
jgi:hypothetical protein